ncbi:SUMF1/EgtB/PvdO family nonheme iron enzyme [Ferrimonas balearica]|uniref:SUMF1/EgtB/PvdO family nonheme iron enzyme n=1 Tax=Ferrimonas balearica TaxID=44012 RepID=UPI001C99AE2C|nr:SUMF1/EgtB/PvdO family nonheme iron enzyme [Ferrimonas balearica]MBY5923319.1 SUMF1/EgtB/PvdO family nonheme iron enzyme [Ferrimonas balearica]MBY5995277.1 SUMF1/EgtB/PvdO family nonheme iron enzyme [Ferrimonas balearica]
MTRTRQWPRLSLLAASMMLTGVAQAALQPSQWHDATEALISGQRQQITLSLFFPTDGAMLSDADRQRLASLAEQLAPMLDGQMGIAISGHTDSAGAEEYNMALSQRRAEAVAQAITALLPNQHIRLDTRYFGETQPVQSNQSASGKAANRRVEITLAALYALGEDGQHPATAPATSFTPDGTHALTTDPNGRLALWQVAEGCPQYSTDAMESSVMASAISPNGRLAASGHLDGTVRLWDLATGTLLNTRYGHEDTVVAVTFSQDGKWLFSASHDRSAALWELTDAREHKLDTEGDLPLSALAVNHNGRRLALGDIGGYLSLWNLATRSKVSEMKLLDGRINDMAYSSNDRFLAMAGGNGQLVVLDVESGERRALTAPSQHGITALAFSPDGQRLAAAWSHEQLTIWDTASGRRLHQMDTEGTIHRLNFNPNGHLLNGAGEAALWQWDTERYSLVKTQDLTRPAPNPQPGQPGEIWREPTTGIPFVWVEGGCYIQGCDSGSQSCARDEMPAQEVCVDGFWMAQTELTQDQWQSLMPANPSRYQLGGDYAVEQVSWFDAQRFTCKLNAQSDYEFRLPTEAEFEYACRNGGQSVTFGTPAIAEAATELPSNPAKVQTGEAIHMPVTELPANAIGLSGLNSHVWEWALDVYDKAGYQSHSRFNPLFTGDHEYHFLGADTHRVERGGGWDTGGRFQSCQRRQYDLPETRAFFTGFRLVRRP